MDPTEPPKPPRAPLQAPTEPPGAPTGYMQSPWGDRDALGRPWPDVQVQPRKARRRRR